MNEIVILSATRTAIGAFQGALASRGLQRSIMATTPSLMSALAAVSQSDLAALMPRRLAIGFTGPYRLKLFEPPYPSPPAEIMLLWHRDYGEQPAVRWLRQIVREVAANV